MKNRFFEKYKVESNILNPTNAGWDQPFIAGNLDNLKSHLLQLRGSDENPGEYFYAGAFVSATLPKLEAQLKELTEEFARFQESRTTMGEPLPKIWPADLEERKEKLLARRSIANEEVKVLEHHIVKLEKLQAKRDENLCKNPMFWGTGSLKDGVLVTIAGWNVRPDKNGLLCIKDDSSPYNLMPCWQFKSQIVNPLHHEHRVRRRIAAALPVGPDGKKKIAIFPVAPKFNKETQTIEYQDYHPEVLKKVKDD